MLEQTEPPTGHCPCCPHAHCEIRRTSSSSHKGLFAGLVDASDILGNETCSSFSTTGNSNVRCHIRRAQLLSWRFLWYCRENTPSLIVPGKSFTRFLFLHIHHQNRANRQSIRSRPQGGLYSKILLSRFCTALTRVRARGREGILCNRRREDQWVLSRDVLGRLCRALVSSNQVQDAWPRPRAHDE